MKKFKIMQKEVFVLKNFKRYLTLFAIKKWSDKIISDNLEVDY